MPNLSNNIARVFTDLHHNSFARPLPQGNDLYIDVDGTGVLNPLLDNLVGWDSVPNGIRSGWVSRSANTLITLELLLDIGDEPIKSDIAENGIVITVFSNGNIRKFDLNSSSYIGTLVFSNPAESFLNVKYAGNGVFYVSGRRNYRITVFKSNDYGDTWNEVYYGPSGSSEGWCLSVKNDMELIVSSQIFYIAKSIDGGTTWTNVGDKGSQIVLEGTYANGYYFLVGYSGSANSFICRSLDGISFSTVYNASDGGRIKSIIFVSDTVGYASGCKSSINANTNGFILKTSDGGATWNEIYYNPNFGIGGIAFKNSGEVYFACSYASTSYLGAIVTYDEGYTFKIINNVNKTWSIVNKPVYYNNKYLSIGNNIFEFSNNFKFKVGQDNSKRFSFFHIKHSPLEAISIDTSTINVLEINLQLKQSTTGTGKFYGMCYFVDSNGYPITVTADVGFGLKNYIGWGVEYANDEGNIKITRLVAVEEFTYPSSGNDNILTVANTLLELTETTIIVNQVSNIRIIPLYMRIYNNVYLDNGNGEPDLAQNPLIKNETVLPELVKNFIFNNRFTTGMLGEGGAGSVDGDGLIDNFTVRWA